ncbi:MAG: cytochrome d ubiquinol oxidase subunit II [Polyangiaceae bacterium]|nr:cytochrome d ubiquinol oxidase subunit II [Polyangiaceae bacterium]
MTLELVWFVLAAASLAAYVVLDGFDLGVGIVHRFVSVTPAERRLTMATIGPVWDGNEVWLLAAGATLFLAFPKLYAVGVGGFYLPVQMLLWLYLGRGLAIEMKHHHVGGPLWDELWDTIFSASSLLIALFLGLALGNVVRGVSFEASGRFFAPLWTNLLPTSEKVGILDVYTLVVGATAACGLALHGALWLAHRTEGEVAVRSGELAKRLCFGTGLFAAITSAATLVIQPLAREAASERPWLLVFPIASAVAIAMCGLEITRGRHERAFYASSAFLVAMLGSASATLYPRLLPSAPGAPSEGITVMNAATSQYALGVGLYWWIPGVLLATTYFVRNYRRLPRRLRLEDLEEH